MEYIKHYTFNQAVRKEENDDHLTNEERKQFLTDHEVEFTEDNFTDKFVDFIF